jgi:hypothetical protein
MKQEFQVHRLNEEGMKKAEAIAEAFSTLLESVEEMCPQSRERSIVVTKLQEASFWAKRSIAVNHDHQQKQGALP